MAMTVDMKFELKTEDGAVRRVVARVNPFDLKKVGIEVVEAGAAGASRSLGTCEIEIGGLVKLASKFGPGAVGNG